MRKHVKILAIGGLLALVLSGCVKLDMDLELQSDDTIDGSMIIAVSRQLAELSGTDPADLADQMRDEALSGDGMPEGSSVESYEDDEFVGSEVTFEGAPLDSFSDEDSLRITRDGDEFVVAGEMDLTDGGTEGLDLTAGIDIQIAITFPGAVSDADGEIDGRTVSWTAEPGEVTTFNARGAAEASALGALAGSMLWLVVGGVALLVIILVVVLVVRSRRKSSAPATAGAGAPGAYDPGAPGTPTAPTAYQPADPAQPNSPTQPNGPAYPAGQPPFPPSAQQPPAPPAGSPDQDDQGPRPRA